MTTRALLQDILDQITQAAPTKVTLPLVGKDLHLDFQDKIRQGRRIRVKGHLDLIIPDKAHHTLVKALVAHLATTLSNQDLLIPDKAASVQVFPDKLIQIIPVRTTPASQVSDQAAPEIILVLMKMAIIRLYLVPLISIIQSWLRSPRPHLNADLSLILDTTPM